MLVETAKNKVSSTKYNHNQIIDLYRQRLSLEV